MSERPARGADQLALCAFLYPSGHHQAAWRLAEPAQTNGLYTARYYQDLARAAERAKFDAIFLADAPVLPDSIAHTTSARLEPVGVLSAVSAVTDRVGLIATVSTTYNEPYNVARSIATLDHLSQGRAGWNIVTTGAAATAANFSDAGHPEPAERYARADEFVQVVTKLWDSWDADAIVADPVTGLYTDSSKIHPVEHAGPHFRVRGPLNIPRSPQHRPVAVQAGASAAGVALAAKHSEVVFTAQQTCAAAAAFRGELQQAAAANSRLRRPPKVLVGICPIVGRTDREAQRKLADLEAMGDPAAGLAHLRSAFGIDLSGQSLDDYVDPRWFAPDGSADAAKSRRILITEQIVRERPTLRQLLATLSVARGHLTVVGSANRVARTMREWFEAGAADGFVVMPATLPDGLRDFGELVVPLLQDWGLFRLDYTGSTLRAHLGIDGQRSDLATAER